MVGYFSCLIYFSTFLKPIIQSQVPKLCLYGISSPLSCFQSSNNFSTFQTFISFENLPPYWRLYPWLKFHRKSLEFKTQLYLLLLKLMLHFLLLSFPIKSQIYAVQALGSEFNHLTHAYHFSAALYGSRRENVLWKEAKVFFFLPW